MVAVVVEWVPGDVIVQESCLVVGKKTPALLLNPWCHCNQHHRCCLLPKGCCCVQSAIKPECPPDNLSGTSSNSWWNQDYLTNFYNRKKSNFSWSAMHSHVHQMWLHRCLCSPATNSQKWWKQNTTSEVNFPKDWLSMFTKARIWEGIYHLIWVKVIVQKKNHQSSYRECNENQKLWRWDGTYWLQQHRLNEYKTSWSSIETTVVPPRASTISGQETNTWRSDLVQIFWNIISWVLRPRC